MLSLRFALWAAAAGALIPVMAVLNARLGRTMGEPMHAPVVLFLAGLLFCIAAALVTTGSLPVPSSVRSASILDLAGGLIGGF